MFHENEEIFTLLELETELMSRISQDPASISKKLMEKGVISEDLAKVMQDKRKKNSERATQLFADVKDTINRFPHVFVTFINVLKEFSWMKNTVESMERKYEENKIKVQLVL